MVKVTARMRYPKPTLSESLSVYRIHPELGMRVEEYRGRVSLEDVKGLTRAMANDPRWSPDLNGLVDLTGATLDFSADDVLRLALMWREDAYRSRGWLAYGVSTSAVFGVVRMLGYWSRTTERSRIFTRREEAEEWLREQGRRVIWGEMDSAIPA